MVCIVVATGAAYFAFAKAPDSARVATPMLSERAEKAPRVGIQVGHWKNSELPDEFPEMRARGGGASAGGVSEWQVNLSIGQQTKQILEAKGYIVDLLPATTPENYKADAFISIHADGSANTGVSGYKVAASRFDRSGAASVLASLVDRSYAAATAMPQDTNITSAMTGYYAFNHRRFEHSINSKTPAVIIETGFLTNSKDRQFLTSRPELAAKGIADGIVAFLEGN